MELIPGNLLTKNYGNIVSKYQKIENFELIKDYSKFPEQIRAKYFL